MIIDNVNPVKLTQEFWDNGIIVLNASNDLEYINGVPTNYVGTLNVSFAYGTDMILVQSIIDAHDPTPITPAPSETEKLRLEMARSNAEMFEMMVAMMGGGV